MADAIDFKFKYLDNEGNETGRAKAGSFDGETLQLDEDGVPVLAVLKARRRFNRLILTLPAEEGGETQIAFAVTTGDLKLLLGAINATASARQAELHQEALAEKGQADRFRSHQCPHCHSTVDLTDSPSTDQVYCSYCETILVGDAELAIRQEEYTICDGCGYFARPREFTIFYFYFLVFVYGWSSHKRYVCSACMRKAAWKMLFGNLLFVLGVPFAIGQLLRAYMGDKGGGGTAYAGLDKANLLARKKRPRDALAAYMALSDTFGESAGIRYNCGMTFANVDDLQQAAEQFASAVALCGNHTPSLEALAACYHATGQEDKLRDLKAAYGVEEEKGAQEGTE